MFWMGAYTLLGEVGGGWALPLPHVMYKSQVHNSYCPVDTKMSMLDPDPLSIGLPDL
jgi:hypothetical protein